MRVVYIQDQEVSLYDGRVYHSKSEHFFERFLAGLSENEILTVYTGIKEEKDHDKIKKYKCVSHERIRYEKIPEFRKISNLYSILILMRNVVKNADFCYLRCGIASSFAGFFCNKYKIPYMTIVNEDVFKSNINHTSMIVKLSAYPLLFSTKYIVENANYSCYVTQNYLQKCYHSRGEMLGCSDIEYLEIDDDSLKRRTNRLQTLGQIITLGSVGNVSTVIKGHDTAIKALGVLKEKGFTNYNYQLVGLGNPQNLKNLAEKYGVDNQIQFLGEFSHDDVLRWFENIDLYLHPSRSEGLPRTILEAMTKATPCVCSDVGGIPELINDNFLFSYNGNEIEDLARILQDMSIEKMRVEAVKNFEHSKDYNPELLEKRRSAFL